MRGMIAVANLIPSILIVIFVTMMVRELLKTDSFLLQANDSAKTSIIVIVIALIVVGVELSTGILMSPGADPEILKGGCTKFSGPELPCSRFDPFLNLL